MENLVISPEFWKDKKVFITGHTGFKGSWISLWLHQLGAIVSGFSLEPPTEPSVFELANVKSCIKNNFIADIRDLNELSKALLLSAPDIVIHMAAQSLVRDSYDKPVATYEVNVMGTVNVFEAIRSSNSVKAILNITTDKCYENREWVWGYRERDPMGGYDPYSSSKGCAELVSSAYRRSFYTEKNIALATARAGNVIGGGDWAKDRIVPDAMRAFTNDEALIIRNPLATRPWQHVLEPLAGYLMLCQQMIEDPAKYSEGWNFGPKDEDAQPVSRLGDIMVKSWSDGATWQLDGHAHPYEAKYLKLDCSKANSILGWEPIWRLERALDETVKWYKANHQKKDMQHFTLEQIALYQNERLSM